MRVLPVQAEVTHPLRREVMGWQEVISEYDLLADAVHFAVMSPTSENTALAVCSSGSLTCPIFPDASGYKIWGLAVGRNARNLGLGRLLVEHVMQTGIDLEKEILWGDARQSALDYHMKHGFILSDTERPTHPNSGLQNYLVYQQLHAS